MPFRKVLTRSQAWQRRLTVPQFTVVTGLLVILLGTLLGIMGLFLADPIVAMIKVALEREAERNAGAAPKKKAAASA